MLTHKLGNSIGELLKFTIEKRHQHVETKEQRMMLFGARWVGFSQQDVDRILGLADLSL
jgi:hypothetical protein